MRIAALLIFVCITLSVSAQGDVTVAAVPHRAYDSIRLHHVKPFPDHFFIWPVLKQRRLDFVLEDMPHRNKRLTFRSNKPYSLGVGMYLFEVVLEIAVAVPLDQKNEYIYGSSDARDLQLNLFGKKWGIDLFNQKYEGFYITDPRVKIPPSTPYPQHGDITTRNVGVTGHYVFNNKKFSFRSAYNFTEKQLHSAGSFILFGSISRFKTVGDSALLGEDYAQAFGNAATIKEIKSTSLSVAPGYTYSLIHKGFFINGALAVGPAHNWLFYETESNQTRNDIKFSTFFVARIGMGYNGDRFFTGISYTNQGNNAKFDIIQLMSSTGMLKILFGYRFREFGILKKRVVDIPKMLGLS